jgi:hypothetical protein
MFECLFLLQKGAKWIPLIVVPAVIAGVVASMCLILSGVKGIIMESFRPKHRVRRDASSGRVVQWIAASNQRHHL